MRSNTRAHVDVSDVAGTLLSHATATAIVGYTLVHFAGFIALGVVAAVVVRMASSTTVLAGAFLAFVIAEAAFWVVIGAAEPGDARRHARMVAARGREHPRLCHCWHHVVACASGAA